MAAQPIGRFCECGCGQSIDHMSPHARFLPPCKRVHALKMQRSYDKQRSERRRRKRVEMRQRGEAQAPDRPRQAAARKSTARADHPVYSESQSGIPDKPRGRMKCQVCCDMQDARVPERKDGLGRSVVGPDGKCRGCGDGWAPTAPLERCETLRSSAGMAVREGALHGYNTERGFNMKRVTSGRAPSEMQRSARGGKRGQSTLRLERVLGLVKSD